MEIRIDYGLADAKIGHNVLHARYTTSYPGTIAMANALKTAIVGGFVSSAIGPYLSSGLTINAIAVRDLGVLNATYLASNSAAQAVGTDSAQPLPVEVAAVITERTLVSGPGGRGRIYIPGWTVSALATGNVILPAAVTALTTLGSQLQAAIAGQNVTMCLALKSRVAYTGKTGTQHPARAATTADITQLQVRDNHWDSMRRRGLR